MKLFKKYRVVKKAYSGDYFYFAQARESLFLWTDCYYNSHGNPMCYYTKEEAQGAIRKYKEDYDQKPTVVYEE